MIHALPSFVKLYRISPLDKPAAVPYNNSERADTRQRFSPVSLGFKNRNRHLPGWRFLRFLIMIVTV